jgi:hypothetical protein
MEDNFESTRKILSSQAEINQEISSATKIGWWRCVCTEENEEVKGIFYVQK